MAQTAQWCPYPDCDFSGTEDQVDQHRAENHRSEAQEGSNLNARRRPEGEAQRAYRALQRNIDDYYGRD
jgi:hypothetical protein